MEIYRQTIKCSWDVCDLCPETGRFINKRKWNDKGELVPVIDIPDNLQEAHDFMESKLNIPKHSKEDIEMRLKVNRTHEECNDCQLEWINPPECEGHASGPVCCSKFKGKR